MIRLFHILILFFPIISFAEEYDFLFDTDQILDIQFTFSEDDFLDQLYENYEDEIYIPVTFECAGEVLDSVGIRFKGNSSFNIPTDKKPLNIDFNEYVDDLTFFGLKKLVFSNGFKDPTFLREKLAYEFFREFSVAPRTSFAKIYFNDEYLGFYTMTEHVDKVFIQDQFGYSEDGNLYKGDPHGTLVWMGDEVEPYKDNYEKKTNEDEDDWSDLIHFIDILNNEQDLSLPDSLDPIFMLGDWQTFIAANVCLVNLDAYQGSGHNYYIYHRDDNGKFIHIPWDTNEAFGVFTMGMDLEHVIEMPPYWLPPPNQQRPLAAKTFIVDNFKNNYDNHLAYIVENYFTEDYFFPRIDELADLIREDVYADENKMYSSEDFETNLEDHLIGGHPPHIQAIPGLKAFVLERRDYLLTQIGEYDTPPVVYLNEFMAINDSGIVDEAGDFEDWIELYNPSGVLIDIGGLYLTDDIINPTKFLIPEETVIEALGYIIFFADNDEEEGELHTNFQISGNGEELAIFASDGVTLIDSISFSEQFDDVVFERFPDGSSEWMLSITATPGEVNIWDEAILGCTNPEAPNYDPEANVDNGSCEIETEESEIIINEFLAKNEATNVDEFGEYDDWIELYYNSYEPINLEDYSLTDALDEPTKWIFPNIEINGEGYLLIWADDDEEQGDLHTNFKLSGNGEEIGLYAPNGDLLDGLSFGAQNDDVSYGRISDGADAWQLFEEPTPGATNLETPPYLSGDINSDGVINILDVVMSVNFVLGIIDPTEEQFIAADINEDGILNVLDIVQIVNMVLE